jgi:hypothetical protein
MGELSGIGMGYNDSPEALIAQDRKVDVGSENNMELDGFDGIKCAGKHPIDGSPIFSVPKDQFFQNTDVSRMRLRFSPDSDVQKFIRNGKYRQNFWIKSPQGYLRKIK